MEEARTQTPISSQSAQITKMAPPQKAARPGEIWVAIATSSKRGWIRIASDRAFAAAGIERHVAFEINDLQTILDLVDAGLGVAILPRSLAPLRTRLRFIRLRGKPPRWNVTLVAPAHLELSAAARAFYGMVAGEST